MKKKILWRFHVKIFLLQGIKITNMKPAVAVAYSIFRHCIQHHFKNMMIRLIKVYNFLQNFHLKKTLWRFHVKNFITGEFQEHDKTNQSAPIKTSAPIQPKNNHCSNSNQGSSQNNFSLNNKSIMSTGWETTSPRHEAKKTNGNSEHSSNTSTTTTSSSTRRSSYVFIKELFT